MTSVISVLNFVRFGAVLADLCLDSIALGADAFGLSPLGKFSYPAKTFGRVNMTCRIWRR